MGYFGQKGKFNAGSRVAVASGVFPALTDC
jgi:hypothetical protein